ncbi:MAG TPA: Rieske 2Fe-2S domain-containing protein [Candidatus Lustribacter sp.]|jgi:5,5'-dehydrodivanillate O-demethylase|nr:Rieske 2Fe-2S domain-containing protein [Candidatus Lustribacter sp.]
MAITERETPLSPPKSRRHRPSVDLTTTKPGTPGGIFMRQFWHAICCSTDVTPGHAIPVRIMNEDFALYRGLSGRAQLVAERCPHRGAQMHLGWIENDDIRCVYHGWKYDCTGQCVEAPAEKDGFAQNVSIPVFPTREAFGLVYGYFGDDEPPAFPPYPESHGEGYVEGWPVEHVPCNYLQAFENSMDEVHVAYTHSPGGSHADLAIDLPVITAEEAPWGMMRYGKRASGMVRHTLHYAPNIVRVIVPPLMGMDGVGGWPEITFHFTPVDDDNHLWIITAKVKVSGDEVELYKQKRAEFYKVRAASRPVNDVVRDIWAGKIAYADVRHPELVIVQDIAVQAGQGRVANREAEINGRSDAGLLLWRRILERELQIIASGGTPKRWQRPPDDLIPLIGIPGKH